MKDLNKVIGACLTMQAYDSFAYTNIIPVPEGTKPEDSEDQKLAEFLIEKFKIPADIYNHLNASKIDKDRFNTFKMEMETVVKGDNMTQYDFSYSGGNLKVTRMKDEKTACYLIEGNDKIGCYIIY